VAARAASSVSARACTSATEGSRGAFQDEVPGVGVVQGTGAVQGRSEPAEQGGVAELDVADVAGGGLDPAGLDRVAGGTLRGLEPVRVRRIA
jgi:hypothetical protein